MPKRTFDTKQLLNEWRVLDDPISDRVVDTGRWSIHHEVIFRAPDDGKAYEAYYAVGATEYQEESAWEYDKTVEATEVHEVEVLVKKWVEVPEEARAACDAPDNHQWGTALMYELGGHGPDECRICGHRRKEATDA